MLMRYPGSQGPEIGIGIAPKARVRRLVPVTGMTGKSAVPLLGAEKPAWCICDHVAAVAQRLGLKKRP
jgi:hypothetical protein